MAISVLLILGVLWGAVLLPPLLRSRSEKRRDNSVGDFIFHLGAIGRTGGHDRAKPNGKAGVVAMTPKQRRQRDILVALGLAAGISFLLALVTGFSNLWTLNLVADLAFGGYLFMLVRAKQAKMLSTDNVLYLESAEAMTVPLRRSASS